jgi:hypothetical protein
MVGFEPVPVESRPLTPPRLSRAEEADATGDTPHAQVVAAWDERLAGDMALGVVAREEVERARAEIEQGAAWTQSL